MFTFENPSFFSANSVETSIIWRLDFQEDTVVDIIVERIPEKKDKEMKEEGRVYVFSEAPFKASLKS